MQTPVKQGFRGRNASPTDRRGPEVTQHVIRIQNPNQLSGKIPVCLSLNQKIQSIRCRFFKGLATQTHPLGFKEREIFKKVQSLKNFVGRQFPSSSQQDHEENFLLNITLSPNKILPVGANCGPPRTGL